MNFNDQKKIRREIRTLFAEGKNKSEIFNLLKEKVSANELTWLSGLVASVLPEEVKVKYKFYIAILSVLFTASFLVWIYYPFKDYGSIKYLNYLITLVFVISVVVSLYSYDVSNLTGIIYLGCIMVFAMTIKAIDIKDINYELWVILPFASILLVYRLRKILFPEVNTWGRVKKDEKGNYIFND